MARAGDTDIDWFLSVAVELVPAGTRDPEAILDHFRPGSTRPFAR